MTTKKSTRAPRAPQPATKPPEERLPALVTGFIFPAYGCMNEFNDDEEFRALAEVVEWFVNEDNRLRREDMAYAILSAAFKNTKAHFQLVYEHEEAARKQTIARRVRLAGEQT